MCAPLGSEIVLTGTVQSWAEYGQAGDAAWATPGVTAVLEPARSSPGGPRHAARSRAFASAHTRTATVALGA